MDMETPPRNSDLASEMSEYGQNGKFENLRAFCPFRYGNFWVDTRFSTIRSPRTYSRHGTAARAMRSDQIRSATRGGETVDQVPSGDPIPLWGVPWSNARCAIDSLPRHASQGIVSPRSYSPSHAHDALHVWALRICTAGQQTHVGDWVLWWRWWCGQTNHVLLR